MKINKITEEEFNVPFVVDMVAKNDAIKVFTGDKTIRIHLAYPLIDKELRAGMYTYLVLVPEVYTEINWNHVFRAAHESKKIKNRAAGIKTEKLQFESFDLNNGSVLFAFK